MFCCPFFDVSDQLRRGRPGPEQLADPLFLEGVHVLRRNDPAAHHEDVVAPGLVQQLPHAWKQREVRAREDGEAHDIHVLLHRRLGDHLRRLVQAGIDHLHASVPQRRGDDFSAAVVPVETGLRDQHADRPLRRGHQRRNRNSAASPSTVRRAVSSYNTSTCTRWRNASSIASSMRASSFWPSANRVRTCPLASAFKVAWMPLTAHPVPSPSCTASAWARSQARSRWSRSNSAASCTSAGLARFGFSLTTPSSRSRSEEHTSELQSRENLVCRLLLEKKKKKNIYKIKFHTQRSKLYDMPHQLSHVSILLTVTLIQYTTTRPILVLLNTTLRFDSHHTS